MTDENGNPVGDRFGLGPQKGLTGTVMLNTSARFYEGMALPPDFIPNNPDTYAHSLPSTTKNPNLTTDNATPPVERKFTHSW